jgi:hypothetical protein
MPPGVLDRVRMSDSTHINEADREIHSLSCVAVRLNVQAGRPAVTEDCNAGFDPITKNSQQRVGSSSGTGTRNVFPDSR